MTLYDDRRRKMLRLNNTSGIQIPRAGLAAAFDANFGITASGGFASAWADQSGNGRNLLQATGANQPIHLPFVGEKYGYLPGVAGNYFSTPDAAANSITGDIDIRMHIAMDEWTPAALSVLASKWDAAVPVNAWYLSFRESSNGILTFTWTEDGGATAKNFSATVPTGVADGSYKWIRVTLDVDNGAGGFDGKFYLSDDGETWTQLGATVTGGETTSLYDAATKIYVGSARGDLSNPGMQCKRFLLKNGIDGTTANDFDPSRWTTGSTFTASTGETWTINGTGNKPAQVVDRSSLLFDGASHYMQSVFTFPQPATVYLVGKQISWTLGDAILDGANLVQLLIQQNTATPKIAAYAGGGFTADNSDLAIGARGVVSTVFNGASSSQQVNNGTATTGDTGVGTAGGITLGARSSGANPANIQAYELLAYSAAHDAATRANIIRALMSKHGVA